MTNYTKPEYNVWATMKGRCYNKNNPAYKNYGARGIEVCESWKDSFVDFYRDMGERPEGYTLDRIDNDKGYSKDNCRWTDWSTQARNRRNTHKMQYQGRERVVADVCEELDINLGTILCRISKGMTAEDAIDKPIRGGFQEKIIKDLRSGMRNIDVARKYNFTTSYICQLRKKII